jgi:hypothetical protein
MSAMVRGFGTQTRYRRYEKRDPKVPELQGCKERGLVGDVRGALQRWGVGVRERSRCF